MTVLQVIGWVLGVLFGGSVGGGIVWKLATIWNRRHETKLKQELSRAKLELDKVKADREAELEKGRLALETDEAEERARNNLVAAWEKHGQVQQARADTNETLREATKKYVFQLESKLQNAITAKHEAIREKRDAEADHKACEEGLAAMKSQLEALTLDVRALQQCRRECTHVPTCRIAQAA